MKAIIFAISFIFSVATARVVITAEGQHAHQLLGAKACTWGPGYWCMNITNAAGCKATSHCIKNVWSTMQVPEDHDSVCDICKDMVTQARDQLQSNQTQEDLKAVFEGSCKLMVIDQVVKECDRLVDEFIPELVETLASQMNPSVVCSVAGLCNSARIDQLLVEHEAMLKKINAKVIPQVVSLKNDELKPDECSRCYTIATHMENKLSNTPRDKMAQEFLELCGRFSSFSDACSSIVLVHFETIYSHLKDNFKANNICHLSGQCSGRFHKHEEDTGKEPEVEIRPLSSVGMVEVGDDLPCKLCEQLVGHLRDLLVANTTEIEFQQVLHGLCKQTKSFADECVSIVDQYYPEIYEYLVHGLNSNAVCEMGGICPAPDKKVFDGPIMPLLPAQAHKIGVRIMNEHKKNLGMNGAGQRQSIRTEADEMQLPIERFEPMFGSLALPNMDVQGQQTCAFCEYLLHYLQQAITNPMTEEKMKEELSKVCKKLPGSVEGTCEEFIETYGDAVVALLAQEVDPSVVCPMMHVCPSQQAMDAWEAIPKAIMIKSDVEEKPSCPLCLLAVTQLYQVIKNNKTEENIVKELDKLCNHLPKDLNNQCVDLVKGYSKELVELLLSDLEPQEVCAYLKLCNANKNVGPTDVFPMDKDGEIMTNEIPNLPIHVVKKVEADDNECVVCEFIMQYIEKAMKNRSTKDAIEKVVHGVCNHLPKSVSRECNDFVDQYAELVIDLLSQDVSPKEICTLVGFCHADMQRVLDSIAECALCQAIVSSIDSMLTDPNVDHKIEDVVGKACNVLPSSKQSKCSMMLKVYEQSIINLLKSGVDTKKICQEMSLCSSSDFFAMSNEHFRNRRARELNPAKQCTWGTEFICSDMNSVNLCNMLDYCKTNVWKGDAPITEMKADTEEKSIPYVG